MGNSVTEPRQHRFTRHLSAASARLKVKMVRYSFLVGLFHPRLHAGLSRRLRSLHGRGSDWARGSNAAQQMAKQVGPLLHKLADYGRSAQTV